MGEHSSALDRGDIRLLGRGGPSTVTSESMLASDDLKIESIIKDGVTQVVTDATAIQKPNNSVADLLADTQQLNQFAASQVAIAAVYTASACTAQAWSLYTVGVTELKAYTGQVIAWAQGGGIGAMPAVVQDSGPYSMGQAVSALNNSPCGVVGSVATPTPTLVSGPKFTPDDMRVAALINAGSAKIQGLATGMTDILSTAFELGKMQTFATSQIALQQSLGPSSCTADA
jgi:hypothetical protein